MEAPDDTGRPGAAPPPLPALPPRRGAALRHAATLLVLGLAFTGYGLLWGRLAQRSTLAQLVGVAVVLGVALPASRLLGGGRDARLGGPGQHAAYVVARRTGLVPPDAAADAWLQRVAEDLRSVEEERAARPWLLLGVALLVVPGVLVLLGDHPAWAGVLLVTAGMLLVSSLLGPWLMARRRSRLLSLRAQLGRPLPH